MRATLLASLLIAAACGQTPAPIALPNADAEGKGDAAGTMFTLRERGDHETFVFSCDEPDGCDVLIWARARTPDLGARLHDAGVELSGRPYPLAELRMFGEDGEHLVVLSAHAGAQPDAVCVADPDEPYACAWSDARIGVYAMPRSTKEVFVELRKTTPIAGVHAFGLRASWTHAGDPRGCASAFADCGPGETCVPASDGTRGSCVRPAAE